MYVRCHYCHLDRLSDSLQSAHLVTCGSPAFISFLFCFILYLPIFSGGLETLFAGNKIMHVRLPDHINTVGTLISWVRDALVRERHDLFASADGVRPGILVLINDVDWELEGKASYKVESGDRISFISTLHGG